MWVSAIVNIPDNLGDYYDGSYYSFSQMGLSTLERCICKVYAIAPQLASHIRRPGLPARAVIRVKPKAGARVLDVGCGGGRLVMVLRAMGFNAMESIFFKTEMPYVRRSSLADIESGWDLIMFHHSLEHMTDHIEVLHSAKEKLAAGGTCLVRIPVANWAWQHYGANWVQLDAPRHLIIHTQGFLAKPLKQLASQFFRHSLIQTHFSSMEAKCASRTFPCHRRTPR